MLRWQGSNAKDKPPVMFMNHHDVVEADGIDWLYPPFSGTIADGKVWGRGTLDTKGGLWAMLQAAEELIARALCRRGTFILYPPVRRKQPARARFP